MAKGARFVSVPAERLLRELREIGDAVKGAHGGYREDASGSEIVAVLIPPGGRVIVKCYTTIAIGAARARGCGDDAVRIVLVAPTPEGERAVSTSTKILRTAPRGDDEGARVEVFVARLREALRAAYGEAMKRPTCPECGRAMARRKGRSGEFLGCIGFPSCRFTLPMKPNM